MFPARAEPNSLDDAIMPVFCPTGQTNKLVVREWTRELARKRGGYAACGNPLVRPTRASSKAIEVRRLSRRVRNVWASME